MFRAEKAAADFDEHIGLCEYFVTDKIEVSDIYTGFTDETSFHHVLITEGEGIAKCKKDSIKFRGGDSLLIAANSGEYEIIGECEALITSIPEVGKN